MVRLAVRNFGKSLPEGVHSALVSSLIILKFVVPFYILSDVLLYFDLLRPLGILLTPLTKLLHLPVEAAPALIGGMTLNVYTAIAFAAPLPLTPYQWTILGIFIGLYCRQPSYRPQKPAREISIYGHTLRVLCPCCCILLARLSFWRQR